MTIEGVMLTYNYSSEDEHAKILTVSASGIKYSDRWVLAHGSMLSPLQESKALQNSIGKATMDEEFYAKLPEVYVTCERRADDTIYEKVEKLSRDRDMVNGLDLGHSSYQIRVLTGRICHVWQCPVLAACVEEVIFGWTVGHRDGEHDNQGTIGKSMLSIFVLIDLGSDDKDYKKLRPLSSLLDMVKPPPGRGTSLEVHSTPFGCEAFLNTVTRGWVSRVIGSRPSLILTDATTALGSEGGPVFTYGPNKELVAMVVCSLSWWRGEWVGLTMVAPLTTILTTKLNVIPPTMAVPATVSPRNSIIESIDACTVRVRCGASSGAGVYVGRGYVLTAAHVVRNYTLYKVTVCCQGRSEVAIVRFKAVDDRAYDLALLFTNPQHWTDLTPATIAKKPAVTGEPVLAAGFPYHVGDGIQELVPTVTTGHVNNVSPSMVQTSCCVQGGFSGGPILRITEEQQVEVLGIITCNATSDTGALHPHLNMCVPLTGFDHIINEYIRDKDLSRLEVMNVDKDIIQSQWRLQPYRSKI